MDALLQGILDSGDQAWIWAITNKDGNVLPNLVYQCVVYLSGQTLVADFNITMEWDWIDELRKLAAMKSQRLFVPTSL
jgi:hypothetical protein